MRLSNVSKVCLNVPLVVAYARELNVANLEKTVFFQDEHNLVLPGGRSLEPDDPLGVIPSIYNPQERYHVRVARKQRYYQADIIVEYNVPNVVNIKSSGIFPDEVMRKIVYAPSLPWPYQTGQRRELAIISNVPVDGEPRREEIMRRLRETCPEYQNVQGSYEWNDVQQLYANTKILVNFHRTWHHHSIEEFRILPALSQGCVVISEDVPLRESIPYHEYVIWCSYDELPAVTAEVWKNYDSYYQRIHGGGGLAKRLDEMKDEFRRAFRSVL
jgi:hypothetical protein